MTSREKVLKALQHQSTPVPVDFGASSITGIHCSIVEGLRQHYGLEQRPVKVMEPFQMLGDIEDDLLDVLGVDVVPIGRHYSMMGFPLKDWKPWTSPWGQELLVPGDFNVTEAPRGFNLYPKGNMQVPPCAYMPKSGYFFDSLNRQGEIDEDELILEDNLEEFTPLSDADIQLWADDIQRLKAQNNSRATLAHLPMTGFGDIALVPAMNLELPKGVRSVEDWYMLLASDEDFVADLYDAQCDIALKNVQAIYKAIGNDLDVAVVCGTDFGTQTGTFCSLAKYQSLWHPRYQRINDWIHANTTWKTFKHCCGAVESFMDSFIESGFDIMNPVQCSATGMDPQLLKQKYGDKLTFWGAAVDTQQVLPYGSPEDVRRQVLERLEIFSPQGGFVFNAIHNVQARTPIANVVAMIDALKEFNA